MNIIMEKMLSRLFDFQRFQNNERIKNMIADTESLYNGAISDDMLEFVNAAGEIDTARHTKKDGDADDE